VERAHGSGTHGAARGKAAAAARAEAATELRKRAERRLGEMMAAQPKATGGEHGGKKTLNGLRNNPSNPTITLDDAGIDKNLAHRARKATSTRANPARRAQIAR
jgi:hypothetical protein